MIGFFRSLWGDLTKDEFKRFGILSTAIALILGNYWMLRITKDSLFDILVGYRKYQPFAKGLSLFAMVFLVLAYSKLLDLLRKQHLMYLLCAIYGTAFIAMSYIVVNPSILSVSPTSFLYPLVKWIPSKVPGGGFGWVAYILLESYGSLLVALFYSFVASVMTTDSAKKGYGMMAAITQFGTISGTLFTMFYVKRLGNPMVYFIGGCITFLIPVIIRYYLSCFPQDSEVKVSDSKKRKGTGFWEGLRLIISSPYIIGVFVVVTFYEIISTVVEYQMNWMALNFYTKEAFSQFRSYQALGINALALIFAFLGTSFFMRRYGLKFCLTAFPVAIGCIVGSTALLYLVGVGDFAIIWVLMCASIMIKGFNYALNKPSAEVMYIPTSKDVKFKSKGWIDTFGNRSTKATGSGISKTFGYSFGPLMLYGALISLGIVGMWILVARFVGNKFNKLQEENKIIQ